MLQEKLVTAVHMALLFFSNLTDCPLDETISPVETFDDAFGVPSIECNSRPPIQQSIVP